MSSRRLHASHRPEFFGGLRLIFAYFIVWLENILDIYARPLMLIGFFAALAWLGFFRVLYPWAHLVALGAFTLVFFEALGKSRRRFHPAARALAKRRTELASGLRHRPLDTLEDRPLAASDEQRQLWLLHKERAREQVRHLRWPRWMLSFKGRDPFALRYVLLILFALGLMSSWGIWGGRLIAAINPELGREFHFLKPPLDAWITPPEYTGLPPIMIATPAGLRHKDAAIDVPEGSMLTAHLADGSDDTPTLAINGKRMAFAPDGHSDFGITQPIKSGDRVAMYRGWQSLGSWRIRLMPDAPPSIGFSQPPSATAQQSVRLAYKASDDYGVTSVSATITPRESVPGVSDQPVTIKLAAPDAKQLDRVSFADLTASPWAGMSVQIQLTATDAAGHVAHSEPQDFVLPERVFAQPLARVLIEERRQLLRHADDNTVRDEVANVMAGIAHQPAAYHDDPLVLLALRSGAVRLVLNPAPDATGPVADLLWQTAARIEDGSVDSARANLRQAQKDLAAALDKGAGDAQIEKLIDRLHQALAQYLSRLSAEAQPAAAGKAGTPPPATNVITPNDLMRMLDHMRDLSATGQRAVAQQELQQLQQFLENLRNGPPPMTAEQKAAQKRLEALQTLSAAQQKLLDDTFRNKSNRNRLAARQDRLRHTLNGLIGKSGDKTGDLKDGARAMKDAGAQLQQGAPQDAMESQNQALGDLQRAIKSLQDQVQSAMLMLPRPGMGFGAAGADPFGRAAFDGFIRDDGSVKVPDKMDARRARQIMDELERRAGDGSRPQIERDYIERLLRNF